MAESTPRPYTIGDLLRVMARLRDPESGCPWDREQSFETIAPYTIEEAYEVADAIARNDLDALKDELGDLLLQVVYHARMAEEDGRFAFADVVDAITAKMIRRHPHVFEDASLREAFLTSGTWERIKAEEKAERGGRDESGVCARRCAGRPARAHPRREAPVARGARRLRLAFARTRARQDRGGDRRAQIRDRR